MTKKRIITSLKKLPEQIQEMIKSENPDGFLNNLIKINKGNGASFYAFPLETEEISYLVKVDVRVDEDIEDLEESLFGVTENSSGNDMDMLNFDSEDDEDSDE